MFKDAKPGDHIGLNGHGEPARNPRAAVRSALITDVEHMPGGRVRLTIHGRTITAPASRTALLS